MSDLSQIKTSVQEYYGKTLQNSTDLQTDACCTADDMTDEQLAVANSYRTYMAEQFGFKSSNVEFLKGDIEKLEQLNLKEDSFDCIISNCVVNLAENKQAVLDQAFKLLKNGGEFYFSDVYSDRRVPADLKKDPVLYGECLSGALYWNDFLKMARQAGFSDVRTVRSRSLAVNNKEIQEKVGDIQFMSTTYRLFKIEGLEEDCEDYGQAVRYRGTIAEHPHFFQLDGGHRFSTGKIYSVCGNTYLMLAATRFNGHFDFWGDFSSHFGMYPECGTVPMKAVSVPTASSVGESCC